MPARERIQFDDSKSSKSESLHLVLHIERYVYAMLHSYKKIVADAACGTCYGSWLLSLVASKVVMIDYDQEALYNWKKFHYASDVETMLIDIEKYELPEADIYVSFETIEHLNDSAKFLRHIPAKQLIFSIPVGIESIFHKISFESYEDFVVLAKSTGWKVTDYKEQELHGDSKFYYGKAVRNV